MRFKLRSALMLLWLPAAATMAQEGPVTLEFSISNPGARSLGLGGAFAALADDATAAYANPAGLVQLIEPEFSFEGRSSTRDTTFVAGGRASGEPTGIGIDTVAGARTGLSSYETDDVSFASLVFPTRRVSFAIYRHIWADFQLNSHVNGLFGIVDGELERSEDVLVDTRVEVVNTGVALGFKLSETFSLGLGVASSDAVIDSISVEYTQEEDEFFESNPFTPELVDTTYTHQGSSTDVIVHAGFLWRASPRFSMGAFYRQGPEVSLRALEVVGPAGDESPEGFIDLDAVTPVRLPDVYGAGFALRTPQGAWTMSFEWTHVVYSSITDDLDTAVFDPDQIHTDDGDELHLGFEYVFVQSRPIVGLRLGGWRDPDHRVGSGPVAGLFEQTIFRSGEPEDHVTAGLGLVYENFQLDLAVDSSDSSDIVSLSFVFRF